MLIALLAVAVLVGLAAGQDLLHVSFIHRHGAREGPMLVNGKMSWEFAELTPAGKAMTEHLGATLRARYRPLGFVPGTDEVPTALRGSVIRTQSTESGRTIQSAYGVRRGLFNHTGTPATAEEEFEVPFIHHIPKGKDWRLAPYMNLPSAPVRAPHWATLTGPAQDVKSRQALGTQNVEYLAELYGEFCKVHTTECAHLGEDFAQCQRSNGHWDSRLQGMWPELFALQMDLNIKVWGYNASGPYAAQGSYGYPLARTFVDEARVALRNYAAHGRPAVVPLRNASFPPLHHYSGHDNTLNAMLNAVGNTTIQDNTRNVRMWVPVFAEAIVFETYSDGTLRFFFTWPDEEHGSGFQYTAGMMPLVVRCQRSVPDPADPARQVRQNYMATACPVDEFSAFVEAESRPLVAEPQCFLAPEDRARCDGVSTAACRQWRKACTHLACPAASTTLSPASWDCVDIPKHGWPTGKIALYAILAGVGAAGVGLVLGIGIRYGLFRFIAAHEEEEGRPIYSAQQDDPIRSDEIYATSST